ncbi:S-adenosyl-L-methionine-dependent methyltransferase [Wilcoxina mikolae CBS 423.85]|nr:S-adenosyl-L-methionine-dependent methyltransferase [Wilcoxina mikolae CBS 423.85]
MPSPTLNAIAQTGFSGADAYDTHRPSYNPLAVEHLLASLNLANKPGTRILELAAGTGKFTTLISARDENFRIVAVEPHHDMLRVLRAKNLSGVQVEEGNAHSIPVEDDWADAMIVAQAFHWFATGQSLKEFARVLPPQDSLGFIWNVEDYNQTRNFSCATSWEASLRDLNWKCTNDQVPRYKDSKWQAIFGQEEANSLYKPLEEKLFRERAWLSKEGLWSRLNTLSNIVNLSAQDRTELRNQFDEILENATDLVRNDSGDIAVHSTCHIAWTFAK